jgi:hypothetical protein
MRSKKYSIILIFLVVLTPVIYYLLPSASLILRTTGYFTSVEPEKNVSFAIESLIDGKSNVFVQLEKENTCYWIRPTMKKGKYVLEIIEYENMNKTSGCIGIQKDTSYIEVDQPISLHGIDCVCSGKLHRFEWKPEKYLKIVSE